MKRNFRLPVLLCLGLGCALILRERLQSPTDVPPVVPSPKPASASPTLLPRQLTHKGVHYFLPFGNGSSPSMYVFEIDSGQGDRGYLERIPHVLHWHKDGLYLLGKGYGQVEYGDHVEVTTSNRVFVNGKERLSIASS